MARRWPLTYSAVLRGTEVMEESESVASAGVVSANIFLVGTREVAGFCRAVSKRLLAAAGAPAAVALASAPLPFVEL